MEVLPLLVENTEQKFQTNVSVEWSEQMQRILISNAAVLSQCCKFFPSSQKTSSWGFKSKLRRDFSLQLSVICQVFCTSFNEIFYCLESLWCHLIACLWRPFWTFVSHSFPVHHHLKGVATKVICAVVCMQACNSQKAQPFCLPWDIPPPAHTCVLQSGTGSSLSGMCWGLTGV